MSVVPKPERNGITIPVVEIDSDDETSAGAAMSDVQFPTELPLQLQQNPESTSPPSVSRSHSFWKAGDYVVGPSSKPSPVQGLSHLALYNLFLIPFEISLLLYFLSLCY